MNAIAGHCVNGISQAKKEKLCMFSLMCGRQKLISEKAGGAMVTRSLEG